MLVLGATGTVGSIADPGRAMLGAERVVAAGRDRDRLERAQSSAPTRRCSSTATTLPTLRAATGGDGPTLVLDALWGEPVRAAVEAAAPRARIVHVGQSAGPETTLASAAVRGKRLSILGHSNFGLSDDERGKAYLDVVEHIAAGRIRIDVETFSIDEVGAAWEAQGRGKKAVVTF